MAQLDVKPKSNSSWWLWLLLLIIVIAVKRSLIQNIMEKPVLPPRIQPVQYPILVKR